MSAEVLREAAREIRNDWRDPWSDERADAAFYLAVADWLDGCASVMEVAPSKHKANALAVARAYLDRSRPGLGTAGVTGAQPDEPVAQAGRPVAGGAG